ncbi:TPA: HNH endonuclease [Legionella pneumophila]|nr:HNH endonuclease [Legionella pneumophila]HCC3243968.1 HNH endonuclease [Legionella pneumophila subsp. pneumophila]HDQ4269291.1 HNH endonuclease [Legionella pneumophila]
MSGLNSDLIAEHLSKQFGLSFSGSMEDIDGGRYVVIRPDDLPKPNGFCITIARTPKIIEASFYPDSFSGSLIRKMGELDDDSINLFQNLLSSSEAKGIRISILINGEPKVSISKDDQKELWRKFELDCDWRLPLNHKYKVEQINKFAVQIASICMSLILSLLPLEEITESITLQEQGLPEGSKIKVEINKYERNPINRAACISYYGPICKACGFDFGKIYGLLGIDFIEVHHIVPVSQMGGTYRIDPTKDLVPLCSNCHAMVHRKNPPISVEELKKIINQNKE